MRVLLDYLTPEAGILTEDLENAMDLLLYKYKTQEIHIE
jgi:hypothetical protein